MRKNWTPPTLSKWLTDNYFWKFSSTYLWKHICFFWIFILSAFCRAVCRRVFFFYYYNFIVLYKLFKACGLVIKRHKIETASHFHLRCDYDYNCWRGVRQAHSDTFTCFDYLSSSSVIVGFIVTSFFQNCKNPLINKIVPTRRRDNRVENLSYRKCH